MSKNPLDTIAHWCVLLQMLVAALVLNMSGFNLKLKCLLSWDQQKSKVHEPLCNLLNVPNVQINAIFFIVHWIVYINYTDKYICTLYFLGYWSFVTLIPRHVFSMYPCSRGAVCLVVDGVC